MSLSAKLLRLSFARSDAKRDAGLTVPNSIKYISDIPYGGNREYNTLDICFPRETEGLLPVIVSFHGGGYVYGSTKIYKFYCADLASRGFAVVNFNYRLAPEYRFPTPLYDMNAVMEWLVKNGADYHADANNVLLVGDSAGAQLASQYAAIVTNPVYAGIMGITPPKFRLAALGLNCGMYDLERRAHDRTGISSVFADYFGPDPDSYGEQLKVLDYVTYRFPPPIL